MSDGIGNATFRKADSSDAAVIVRFVRLMVTDMEEMGGHVVARDADNWSKIDAAAPDRIRSEDRIYILAEFDSVQVGFGEAEYAAAIPVFSSKKILHISSVYVTPEHRGQGIGKRILKELLNWGRGHGCSEVELNVLVGNPARKLYSDLGFTDFEIKMARKL